MYMQCNDRCVIHKKAHNLKMWSENSPVATENFNASSQNKYQLCLFNPKRV